MVCLVLAAKDQELSFSNPTLLPCASNSKLFNVLELLPPGGSGLGVRQKSYLSSLRRELKWVLPLRGAVSWRGHRSPVGRPKAADLGKELGVWGSVDPGGSLKLPMQLPEP